MVKEVLLAVLAFVVVAIVIIILMTAAGNLLFPSAVSIVETRLETASETAAAEDDQGWTPSGPPTIPHIEVPPAPGPGPGPAGEAPPTKEAPPAEDAPAASPPAAEAPRTEAGEDTAESPAPLPRATSEEITEDHDLSRGEILPLGNGRVAYKVESGDTFSQICKKVIGTGRPQVWRKAAEMMDINIRALRPGMVLIFDEPVLALGEEE